ncbi:NAD(P)/FAD-dependent oxidoreductase [Steroidobacter sp. S1-65]|uniref:NAD(P)/FAD-dependent oxidoreductase n=1 Tax=Steroidobacter gossypii TaxID=2805490 RepID=A0ABS1WZU3_9GAMM|nr:NAD(P)/FAD-dependent oxidoreductase [Steroidobacter gossypii]MBM0106510.1 NAD(P)/FAD-dependent oxidoreductase [Steroidobacter gossypii]
MSNSHPSTTDVTIVGAGFTGLAAAYELAKLGIKVTLLEADDEVGGLASAFSVGNTKLDRFYHILFTTDHEIMRLLRELGLSDQVTVNATNASIYYAHRFFKLSSPWDLLTFRALRPIDRLRLGLLMVRARLVNDWASLEQRSAYEWLRELGGENVFRVVWQPLLKGKFGDFAEQISAVWFWNKLKLRSASRANGGEERFAYIHGGFTVLAQAIARRIEELGGRVEVNSPVSRIEPDGDKWVTVTPHETIVSTAVVATPALPLISNMIKHWSPPDYTRQLERIRYLGNICLVLELDRSLTNSYWLNVNDPTFPFVALIEHTNLESASHYGGRHIVYLSRYMRTSDPLFSSTAQEFCDYAFPYLTAMFPAMERTWIRACHLWRAHWSQPIVEKGYGQLRPPEEGPRPGFFICTMAQIYPEDRGTNYAVRAATRLARRIAGSRGSSPHPPA